MQLNQCKSCGEQIDGAEYEEARETGSLPRETQEYSMTDYCLDCFCELVGGDIPLVTDSHLPAPHTGLTVRQRHALRRTDGG